MADTAMQAVERVSVQALFDVELPSYAVLLKEYKSAKRKADHAAEQAKAKRLQQEAMEIHNYVEES
jgi:uncharacterized membrane protein (DUF106 family)